MVEQWPLKPLVVGSTPTGPTRYMPLNFGVIYVKRHVDLICCKGFPADSEKVIPCSVPNDIRTWYVNIMKSCSKCKLAKPSSAFSLKNKERETLNAYCKECSNEYHKGHYMRNKSYYSAKRKFNNDRVTSATRKLLAQYLASHPCVDCGETDLIMLEFDHVRGIKSNNIATMLRNAKKWEAIESEIQKCEVRCSNCHKRRTAQQLGWKKLLLV